MGRRETKEHRKRSLIEATIACINRYGYAESTIQRIAAEAGVTSGTIYRHFANKTELLEAAMRFLLRGALEEERRAVAAAPDDRAKLEAVITSKFADHVFTQEACVVWAHFWANAQSSPGLARAERLNYRLLCRSLRTHLARLVPAASADTLTLEFAMMIDGLWIAHAQHTSTLTPATARTLMRNGLEARLGAVLEA